MPNEPQTRQSNGNAATLPGQDAGRRRGRPLGSKSVQRVAVAEPAPGAEFSAGKSDACRLPMDIKLGRFTVQGEVMRPFPDGTFRRVRVGPHATFRLKLTVDMDAIGALRAKAEANGGTLAVDLLGLPVVRLVAVVEDDLPEDAFALPAGPALEASSDQTGGEA